MKNLFLIAITMLALAACSKDNNCNDESLATTIIGSWSVVALGQTTGSVEFKADGTLIDDNDAISGGSINDIPLDVRTYTITGDNVLSIKSAAEGGSPSFEFDYDVLSYSCDEISLDVFGLPAKLKR